jgi:hypothetical protein
MARKKYYRIYAECTKESPNVTSKLGEVAELARFTSKGNAWVCLEALKRVYAPYFRLYIA